MFAALGLLGQQILPPRRAEPVRTQTLTFSGSDSQPSASPDGRWIAFTSRRNGQPRIWLKQLADGGETALTRGPDSLPRFSPDGSTVLFIRSEGARLSAYRVPIVGGPARKLIDDVSEVDWSPSGDEIAFLRSDRGSSTNATVVGVADPSDGRIISAWPFKDSLLYGVRWSPDGGKIAVTESPPLGNPGTRILLIDPRTGETLRSVFEGHRGRLSPVVWSGTSRWFVVAQSDSIMGDAANSLSRFLLYDSVSGRQRELFWAHNLFPSIAVGSGGVSYPDIVDTGRLVFDEVSIRQGLQEIELTSESGQTERTLTAGRSADRQPVYSPNGESVLFSSNRSGNLDLWKITIATGEVWRLTDDPSQDWDPAFTPDGQNILWSSDRSGNLEIWTAESDGSEPRQLTSDGRDAENPTASPDGEWLAYWSGNPARRGIWKIRRDGTAAHLLVPGPYVNGGISPDGRFITVLEFQPTNRRTFIRVAEFGSGTLLPYQIEVPRHPGSRVVWGRSRWHPKGAGIAFVGAREDGLSGIFLAEFPAAQEGAVRWQQLAGFSTEYTTESFDISPDGSRLILSRLRAIQSLVLADRVAQIQPPAYRSH